MRCFDAGDGDDVARTGFRHFNPVQAVKTQHLQYPARTLLAFAFHHRHHLARLDAAALDAADGNGADIAGVSQARHLHLQRAVEIHIGRRHVFDNRVEQRRHVALAHVGIEPGVAVQGRGIHHGEIELLLGRAEFVE